SATIATATAIAPTTVRLSSERLPLVARRARRSRTSSDAAASSSRSRRARKSGTIVSCQAASELPEPAGDPLAQRRLRETGLARHLSIAALLEHARVDGVALVVGKVGEHSDDGRLLRELVEDREVILVEDRALDRQPPLRAARHLAFAPVC